MELGKVLTNLCEKQNLSLTELAKKSGVPKQTLHNWTLDRKSVNPDQLKKVAEVLRVSLHYLLYGEEDPQQPASSKSLEEVFSGELQVTIHQVLKKGKN